MPFMIPIPPAQPLRRPILEQSSQPFRSNMPIAEPHHRLAGMHRPHLAIDLVQVLYVQAQPPDRLRSRAFDADTAAEQSAVGQSLDPIAQRDHVRGSGHIRFSHSDRDITPRPYELTFAPQTEICESDTVITVANALQLHARSTPICRTRKLWDRAWRCCCCRCRCCCCCCCCCWRSRIAARPWLRKIGAEPIRPETGPS